MCFNFSAQQLKKEILYTHYDPVDYNFPAQILSIAEDSLGMKYFGTTSGVLIYNGSIWKTLKLPFTVWSLVSNEKGVVYVGGENDFGQIILDYKGSFIYESIANKFDKNFSLQNQRVFYTSFSEWVTCPYICKGAFFFYSQNVSDFKTVCFTKFQKSVDC